MQEIISLVASQASGHLVTQLYNVQESYIPYSKNAKITHRTDVFLEPSKHNGRVNYYPRSLNVQFSGGYGFMGKHVFHESPTDISKVKNVEVERRAQIEKNQFQRNLDEGKPVDASLLDTTNTKYWTDYNKLIYRPHSLTTVEDYAFPDGTHKHFERLKFDVYNVGAEEFKKSSDELDESFRRSLEASDNVQGINIFSELDNGWGGYSNEMLLHLQDEYFNNGVSSKYSIWCFGIGSERVPMNQSISRVKALIEFSKNCTLFFPLGSNFSSSLLSQSFQSSSSWHREAIHSHFVNSIWSGINRLSGGFSMTDLESQTLRGFDRRNVVNEITIHSKQGNSDTAIIDDPRIIEAVLRGETLAFDEPATLSLNLIPDSKTSKVFSRNFIVPKSDYVDENTKANIYLNPEMNDLLTSVTFPEVYREDKLYAEFGQTTAFKDYLKQEANRIQRLRSPKGLEIVGDKEELVEDIFGLIEEYTQGYDSDDEFE